MEIHWSSRTGNYEFCQYEELAYKLNTRGSLMKPIYIEFIGTVSDAVQLNIFGLMEV